MKENSNVITLPSVPETALSHRFERVRLRSNGSRQEPDVLIPGLMLKGQSHLFYGASDTGKSFLLQQTAKEAIQMGLPVLYFDLENGPHVMEERMFETLGLSQDEEEDFYYYSFPDLSLEDECQNDYLALLDSFSEPGLIAWDSLLGFLALSGLSEDSSTDFEKWARIYLDSARARGWTPVVLDHSGHAGDHARGTSRKNQNVQVVWKVEKKEPFDRMTEGRLRLTREKDRSAWLPKEVDVRLGGSPFRYGVKYEGLVHLRKSESRALYLLYKLFGPKGARYTDWMAACCTGENKMMSEGTFNKALKQLISPELGFVEKGTHNYYHPTEAGMEWLQK